MGTIRVRALRNLYSISDLLIALLLLLHLSPSLSKQGHFLFTFDFLFSAFSGIALAYGHVVLSDAKEHALRILNLFLLRQLFSHLSLLCLLLLCTHIYHFGCRSALAHELVLKLIKRLPLELFQRMTASRLAIEPIRLSHVILFLLSAHFAV